MKIGMKIEFRGMLCEIIAIHALGTFDIVTPTGNYYRLSGYPII